MPSLKNFNFNIKSVKHLSLNLRIDYDLLTYYGNNKKKYVKEIVLKQHRYGKIKERIVFNPSDKYKKILRYLNKKILQKYDLPKGVLGAVVGKSIDDMASFHTKKEAVFSLDLKNFFPNITSGRIFNLFLKTGCTHEVSGVLTDLVTFEGALPQGYPTSPMLANIVASDLDLEHLRLCIKHKLARTRWIDDIVISGRTKDLIPNIRLILGTVKKNGFKTSHRKTNFKHRSEQPHVLGLNVSKDKPRVPNVLIIKVMDILLDCLNNGPDLVQELYDMDNFGKRKNLSTSLKGKIDFIERYNPVDAKELRKVYRKIFL